MSVFSSIGNLSIIGSTINVVSGHQTTLHINRIPDPTDVVSLIENTTQAPAALKMYDAICNSAILPSSKARPRVTTMFTGRGDVLSQMAGFFNSSHQSVAAGRQRIFVLYGLGGAGKSQIMSKFVDDVFDQFNGVYYVDASTEETIQSCLEDIARDAGVGQTVDAALRWLSQERKEWLLLLDNADNPGINLQDLFPACRHGNIIITTRNQACRVLAPESNCQVSGMSPGDATELLLKFAMVERSDQNLKLCFAIARELGYLALAIAQAGAYIAQSPSACLSQYLQIYETDRAKLLQKYSGQRTDDYEWTAYTTWEISLKMLTPTAALFLRICAFLHNEGISEAIFKKAAVANQCNDTFQDAVVFLKNFKSTGQWSNMHFQDLINELASYSLIGVNAEGSAYSFHPLVHAWARDSASPEEYQRAKSCATQILALSITDEYSAEALAFRRTLLPHVDHSRSTGVDLDIAARLQQVYSEASRWKEAEEMQKPIMDIRRRRLGDDHPETLTIIANLASTYTNQGRWAEAEELGLRAMEASAKVLGEHHHDTLTIMANLATTYRKQGQWYEAERLNQQVMVRRKQELGDIHPYTLTSMANLAATYWNQGRWKEAERLEAQVVRARKEVLGNEHPHALTSMGNLAETYRKLGRWKEAEPLQLHVVEVRKRIHGNNHPHTLTSIANLASTYREQGRWREAEQLDLQVVEASKIVLGKDHPSSLTMMANLATTYWCQGKWKDAERLDLQVIEARKIILGEDHPSTLSSMSDLASTYRNQGLLEEAERMEKRVVEVRRRVHGDDHPHTLTSMANLASTYRKRGRWKEAEELDLQVMKTRIMVLGEDHPYTLASMSGLASTYRNQGRLKEAEKLGLRVVKMSKEVLGDNHPHALAVVANLAVTLSMQGRWKEAEELELQVVDASRRVLGEDNLFTFNVMANLASTYRSRGQRKQAEILAAEATDGRRRILSGTV